MRQTCSLTGFLVIGQALYLDPDVRIKDQHKAWAHLLSPRWYTAFPVPKRVLSIC